ncbi:hypothetical protein F2Q70_00022863 [Brassica cretica]|uniref:Serine O-acetyltransferase n=1 Tax=Brassica cretica TaxID=69181 RepID=A0A8S9GL72_BRACR|nr:hypothetical protein F2Q70_00022863 [Brassica cretica]
MLEEAKSYVARTHFVNLLSRFHYIAPRFKRKPRDGGVREARPNSSKGKTPNILACQAHRIAHKLWTQDRKILALLIQNREAFAVDFHPGAKIGKGILFDHATGVVIGETAVIGDNVSILHGMTLGGTWNITIGEGAKIGSGSVVLKDVPLRTTAVGNPARLIGIDQFPVERDVERRRPILTKRRFLEHLQSRPQ